MKWSWKITEYRGIPVNIHATFLLIVAWIAINSWSHSQNAGLVLEDIIFVLGIFICVVLHEFGHALMAQKYGIATRDITLYPIGGVARLERMPDDPRQELAIALAGPAVNVVIATAIFCGMLLTGNLQFAMGVEGAGASFWGRMMGVNILLVAFNMLPAFPMDGGRVVRSLLALSMEYGRATRIAAGLGKSMAILFAIVGFYINPFLVLIGVFVWFGATQEANMIQMRDTFGDVSVDSAMMTRFQILHTSDTVGRAVEYLLAGAQQDFPVAEGGNIVGVLTREDIMEGLARRGQHALVGDIMQREFESATIGDRLQNVVDRLIAGQTRIIPVLRDRQIVGLLTTENISEFMMIHSAMKRLQLRTA